MAQKKINKIKDIYDILDEIIAKSKPFAEQIETLKKLEGLIRILAIKS